MTSRVYKKTCFLYIYFNSYIIIPTCPFLGPRNPLFRDATPRARRRSAVVVLGVPKIELPIRKKKAGREKKTGCLLIDDLGWVPAVVDYPVRLVCFETSPWHHVLSSEAGETKKKKGLKFIYEKEGFRIRKMHVSFRFTIFRKKKWERSQKKKQEKEDTIEILHSYRTML